MKTGRLPLCIMLALSTAVLLGGCATGKYFPKANEELYGRWTNDSYSIRKIVYSAGKERLYYHTADSSPAGEGTIEIVSKWTDSQGNTWYKALYTGTFGYGKGALHRYLIEINKPGTITKFVFFGVDKPDLNNYPTEISASAANYFAFYRQAD
jgi:hypothetical protein